MKEYGVVVPWIFLYISWYPFSIAQCPYIHRTKGSKLYTIIVQGPVRANVTFELLKLIKCKKNVAYSKSQLYNVRLDY